MMNSVTESDKQFVDGSQALCVKAAFLRKDGMRLVPAGVVRSKDEVMLAIHCSTGRLETPRHCYELTIELCRGDERRDCRTIAIELTSDQPWRGAYRVTWSDRPNASSRLSCRILIDGREAGRWQVLIADLDVDAQGRLPSNTQRTQSDATLLAYQREYDALFSCSKLST